MCIQVYIPLLSFNQQRDGSGAARHAGKQDGGAGDSKARFAALISADETAETSDTLEVETADTGETADAQTGSDES